MTETEKLNNSLVGFLMGFFLSWFCFAGLIIALVIGGPRTKGGAIAGTIFYLILNLLFGCMAVALKILLQM